MLAAEFYLRAAATPIACASCTIKTAGEEPDRVRRGESHTLYSRDS